MANEETNQTSYSYEEYIDRFGKVNADEKENEEKDFAEELARETLHVFEVALAAN